MIFIIQKLENYYKQGEEITEELAKQLKKQELNEVEIRSVITCELTKRCLC